MIAVVDASLGEILTTCSKLEWLMNHGEAALRPEGRRSNLMMSYKSAEMHYEPLGVVAAIVSWNYRESDKLLLLLLLSNSCNSPPQRMVPNHCFHLCWQRYCAEVLGERHLVH
jgi:Aldehyde dehydrogenase family